MMRAAVGDKLAFKASQADRHDDQIDGLRAIAVSGVLFSHFWLPQSHAGHWGVRLFFVISGFLITRILLANRFGEGSERSSVLFAFYARRVLRIFPAYYFVLLVGVLAGIEGVLKTLPFHALYASNLLFAYRDNWAPWPTSHLWSLSVEEQFYILWPAFMLFLPRGALPAFLLVAIGLSVLFKAICFQLDPDGLDQYVLMPAAIDAMALGGILSNLSSLFGLSERGVRQVARIMLALSLIIVPCMAFGIWGHLPWAVYEFLATIPMGYLVLASSLGIPGMFGKILRTPVVRYVGKISYGIYLWHFFLLALLFKFVPPFSAVAADPGPVQFFLGGSMTIAIAALSWHFLESPVNALKRSFPYRKRMVHLQASV